MELQPKKRKLFKNRYFYILLSIVVVLMLMIPISSHYIQEKQENKIEFPKPPVFHEVYIPTEEYGWILEQGIFEEDGIGIYYSKYEGNN